MSNSKKFFISIGLSLLVLTLWACNFTALIAETNTNKSTEISPTNTQEVILTTQVQTELPLPDENPIYGSIKIIGNKEFVEQTVKALQLLELKAPDAFQKVQLYIGIIEQFEKSGMWAWEVPPRFTVGDSTAFYSVTWYASAIAHDATHSELYHQYYEKYGGEVPDDVWTGVDVERFCIGYQTEVMKQIDGPQVEIDYLDSLDGTHCDLDNDGDCDAVDYENRDW